MFKVTDNPLVAAALLFIVNVPHVGAVLSKTIVFVRSGVWITQAPFLHLIYTVFVPSHALSVCATDAVQAVRFVGFALFQKAI